jgi:hypothetical protein
VGTRSKLLRSLPGRKLKIRDGLPTTFTGSTARMSRFSSLSNLSSNNLLQDQQL